MWKMRGVRWTGVRAGGLCLLLVLGACANPQRAAIPEKRIVGAKWTASDFSTPIKSVRRCQPVGVLIETIGYRPGEFVTLKIREKRDQDFEVTLGGSVDADGMVRIPWEGWCGKRPNAATVVEPQAVPAPETAPVPPSAAANRKRAK